MNRPMEENERLRSLLAEARTTLEMWKDVAPAISLCADIDKALAQQEPAALSQQAEPTDTFTAVEMATAAAQGFRDGQAAVEPAPAQDEQQPVAWGAFHFGGRRSGRLYTHCETEQQIESYIADLHRSNDSITLRKGPLYAAPIAQTAQGDDQ